MSAVTVRQRNQVVARQRAAGRRVRLRASIAISPLLAFVFAFAVATLFDLTTTVPAAAQGFTYNQRAPRPKPPRVANDNQMLVQAVEVDFDVNNSRVSAVGNVQMF